MNMKQKREAFTKKTAVLFVILHPKSQRQSYGGHAVWETVIWRTCCLGYRSEDHYFLTHHVALVLLRGLRCHFLRLEGRHSLRGKNHQWSFSAIKVEMDPMGSHTVTVVASTLTLSYPGININVADSIQRRWTRKCSQILNFRPP